MKRSQLVSQGSLIRLLQAADEARNRRAFQESIELLERANRLAPGNIDILLNLGHAYGKYYDYAGAERSFERAIRMAPKKAEAMAAAAFRARDFGNHKMAERYYRLAADQKGVTAETFIALAEISERLSRLEESSQFIGRALRLQPNFPPALLVLARLERQAGRLTEAEAILRSFPVTPDADLNARAQYELGAILDRQGRYDEAMTVFLAAKAALAPIAGPAIRDLKIMRSRLERMKNGLSADLFQRWFAEGQTFKPTRRLALLGGHPRSGTTLLEQILDAHPDVVSVEETTLFYDVAYTPLTRGFREDESILTILEAAKSGDLEQSRNAYFRAADSFLGEAIGNRLLIDKNPSLTFLIPLLVRVFPEIKVLVALRDPRDVVLSCFMQALPLDQGSAPFLSLESTVEEYTTLMGLWRTTETLIQNLHLEVRYEGMVGDLESVARKTLAFLDIPWDERVLRFNEHAQKKMVRSPTYADVTKPVYKRAVGRWRNYQKYLEPHLGKLEPFAKGFGYE